MAARAWSWSWTGSSAEGLRDVPPKDAAACRPKAGSAAQGDESGTLRRLDGPVGAAGWMGEEPTYLVRCLLTRCSMKRDSWMTVL